MKKVPSTFCRLCLLPLILVLVISGRNVFAVADPMELKDRRQLADGLFRRDMFDLAAREYLALVETPELQERDVVMFRLGECYRRMKKTAEAEAAYQRVIDQFPESPQKPRAQLQRAVLLMESEVGLLPLAVTALEKLSVPGTSPEIRSAALYHLGEVLERLKKTSDALTRYELLLKDYPDTDYGMYAGLRAAWLLTQSGKPEDQRKAMGLYLELMHKAKDPKVAEEACYFASQVALAGARFEESANLFQMLRAKYPNSPRILDGAVSAGWANLHAKRYKEAVECVELVMADLRHPAREEIVYVKANALNHLEKRAEAIKVYTLMIDGFPQGKLVKSAQFERIMVTYRDGQYADVLAMSSRFFEPPPEWADQLYWVNSEAALALKKDDVAVQNCQLLVEKCPKSPLVKDAFYRMGRILQRQEAWAASSTWFLKVAEQFPGDVLAPKALFSSGACLSRLGQVDGALRDWTALLVKYPESDMAAETLYQKAMEELRMKNMRGAGATLDERLRRFPKDDRQAEIFYWRGVIFRQLGEWADAEKMYRAALAAQPSKEFDREIALELGMVLQQTGRKSEAVQQFRKLLDAPIASKLGADRIAWLAEFECEQKQYDEAMRAAQVLISLNVDKGWKQTAWGLMGRAHLAKGEQDAAGHAFREALALGASTVYGTESALRLGELLTMAGKYDEAKQHLEDAATRAASVDQVRWRALAYLGLAKNAEMKGDVEGAVRYYMGVGILFDDRVLVPEAMDKAVALLEKAGRSAEARVLREERKTRYPQISAAGEGKVTP